MTRYARAQGSKAANKREEEEATPWSVMVRGIRGSGVVDRRREVSEKNPEDFDETDDIVVADDDDDDDVKQEESEDDDEQDEEEDSAIRNKHQPLAAALSAKPEPEAPSAEVSGKKKKNQRKKNKCLNCKKPGHLKMDCPELSEDRRKELQDLLKMKVERKGHGTGRKKNKRKAADALEAADAVAGGEAEAADRPAKKKQKREHKPKKVLKDKTGQIVAEGEALFQGFRVKAEDAKRLRALHQTLVKNKAKPEEINEALKRERRRAEKALSNSKKNVCYNCRQPGHMLADCPGNQDAADSGKSHGAPGASNQEILAGVCFKCGSAEHTSKECRSKKKGEQAYQFATCFICHQTGHLAKACPDNPRGLYPKGGGCRFCGSVEHLKNDCPRKIQKDARSEVRVDRNRSGESIEDVSETWAGDDDDDDGKQKKKKGHDSKPAKKKVVAF